ncbi:MAG TPA: T9SS type A sorting domain-containing protein [Bacteroidia bacterium]|jgi:hypothetical protein|nr:T9SS type A sorting domain-containing protein [Bacteroidia bacterium]
METKITNTISKSRKLFLVFALFLINGIYAQQNQSLTESEEEEEKGEAIQCGGVERWSVKVLTDAAVNTINMTPINANVAYMVNIVTPSPSTTMPRYAGVEDKTYSVTCNITIKKVETDNDYHLVLSDGTNTMIGEIPDPTCAAAASSAFVNDYIAARNFIDAHIASGNVSNVNLPPVIVYGVAFVDPPHGQTGKAPNNLEIHPILNVQFANTTGINTGTEILKVSVFPNPVNDKLTLQIDSKVDKLNDCEFQIFNALGGLVKTIELPKALGSLEYTLDVDNLSTGFYYYRITKAGKPLYEGKFIKS